MAHLLIRKKEYSIDLEAMALIKRIAYGLIRFEINILAKPYDCHFILSLLRMQEVSEQKICML